MEPHRGSFITVKNTSTLIFISLLLLLVVSPFLLPSPPPSLLPSRHLSFPSLRFHRLISLMFLFISFTFFISFSSPVSSLPPPSAALSYNYCLVLFLGYDELCIGNELISFCFRLLDHELCIRRVVVVAAAAAAVVAVVVLLDSSLPVRRYESFIN